MKTKFYISLQVIFLLCIVSSIYGQTFNAQYIRMDSVPKMVITDSVFHVFIYMKNNGSNGWSPGADDSLVELVPLDTNLNHGWSVPYIYMGQGNGCLPGDTFCFTSYLMAPHQSGTYSFRWQARVHSTEALFGEIAVGDSITVVARNETPPVMAVPDSVITLADIEYRGSFALPNVNGYDNRWTESGCTFKSMPDGTKRLFLNTGTYSTTLYEIQIPQPVKIVAGNVASLPVANLIKNWGPLDDGTVNGEDIASNCGFWWDSTTSLLYWCHYNGYYTGNSNGTYGFPSLVATHLDSSGLTNIHSWYLPIDSLTKWKGYWQGVTKLSANFAKTYTGGRDMAVGFGGYFSICGSASRGPALAAIRTPVISYDTLDLVEMMTYSDPQASIRDGDYLTNEGIWSTLPKNPWQGLWGYGDVCRAGVFIDLPDKHGAIMFATPLQGDITYYYGGYNFGNPTQQWYFYDPKDLAAAAQGKKLLDLNPVSFVEIDTPSYSTGATVTGACFDSSSRTLYVYNEWYGSFNPIVNVYYVKQGLAKPVILSGPQNKSVCIGQQTTFNVTTVASGMITYQWQKNGINISAGTEANYTTATTILTDNGTIFRCIVSNNSGKDTSNTATLSVHSCPLEEENIEEDISIFPNPATNYIMIKQDNVANIHVQLFDLTGVKIIDEIINNNQISISNITPGMYLLKLNNKTFKIIKQ